MFWILFWIASNVESEIVPDRCKYLLYPKCFINSLQFYSHFYTNRLHANAVSQGTLVIVSILRNQLHLLDKKQAKCYIFISMT